MLATKSSSLCSPHHRGVFILVRGLFWDKANWCRGALRAPTGGHTGPPLRKNRSVIRHCEEGRRPDVAIRAPVQERRIPTAPPGPRNDGLGTQCAPAGGHAGPPLQNPLKCNVERRRGQAPALQSCATRHPPHHGERPGQARLKRIARMALWLPPHSGNGRENGLVSETTPRRYICAKLPNQAPP